MKLFKEHVGTYNTSLVVPLRVEFPTEDGVTRFFKSLTVELEDDDPQLQNIHIGTGWSRGVIKDELRVFLS